MNSTISESHLGTASGAAPMKLSNLERALLLLPTAGGLVFGLLPFLLGGAFGKLLGSPGNDSFIYRLAGAATFGYAVGLILGLRRGDWLPLRSVVIGTLAFNLASIYACMVQIAAGDHNFLVYLILGTSIVISAITVWLLNRHTGRDRQTNDVSAWYVRFITLGTILSGLFGVLPLFLPVTTAHYLGFQGTDVFLIRQAGAASLGYAAIGAFGIRSLGGWQELRLPLLMGLIFNGFSLVASVIALLSHEPLLISLVIGAASLFVTIVGTIAYRRNGKL